MRDALAAVSRHITGVLAHLQPFTDSSSIITTSAGGGTLHGGTAHFFLRASLQL
jgi:hypothetical protein